ncbi:hypothetical protein [Streptomyces sp. NPDC050704]|uniref:hypothetical protein n=1 Tax=Streptomyces sp. NPDC050704 TaxID=3157219 RepID=UPI0034408E57
MSHSDRPTISIAFHSGYGHTAVVAEAVARGAAGAGADAITFGAAAHMGTASAAFHGFAEASSRRWFSHVWVDKLAAGFTNSGAKSGDKSPTLGCFATLAAQHGMHRISLGVRVARQAAIFRAGRAALPA